MEKMRTILQEMICLESNHLDIGANLFRESGMSFAENIEFAIPIAYRLLTEDRPNRQRFCGLIGKALMDVWGLDPDEEKAIRVGAKILEALIRANLARLEKERDGNNRHMLYICKIRNPNVLWSKLKFDRLLSPERKLPLHVPSECEIGPNLIKSRADVSMKSIPTRYIVNILKKQGNIGWRINKKVLKVQKALIDQDKIKAFNFQKSFVETPSKKQKESLIGKEREARTILHLADMYRSEVFYHEYKIDFRGRYYPSSYALNEQSSDTARGLLILNESKPITPETFKWLSLYACNLWGDDKINIKARFVWVDKNLFRVLLYAKDPLVNTGWTKADSPWQFLACCMEIRAYLKAQKEGREFLSSLPIFIDGSCNGIQHISALTGDEVMARTVNLLPNTEEQQDLYGEISEIVWNKLEKMRDPELEREFDRIYALVRNADYEELKEIREKEGDLYFNMWKEFWRRYADKSIRRSIVKRPVMTLGYGVTMSGVKNQIRDDTPDIVKNVKGMEHIDYVWAGSFGKFLFQTCYEELDGLKNVIEATKNVVKMQKGERHLQWTVPVTGLIVKQAYIRPKDKRIRLTFMGKTELWGIKSFKEGSINYSREVLSVAPNFVHSLDAAHISMVIKNSPFTVVGIHDSVGCLVADMPQLFSIVREEFYNLYCHQPFTMFLREHNCNEVFEKGNLVLTKELSNYAFI